MNEISAQSNESAATKNEGGKVAHAESSHRIYRIAAGMGIAVGGVVIASTIFALGYLVGSQPANGWDNGMYSTDSDDMGWCDGWYGGDPDWDPSSPGPDRQNRSAPSSPPASAPTAPPTSRP